MFSRYLIPDYILANYGEVTPEFLASLGVRGLLIDIDNTLAPYEQAEPDEKILSWLAALSENGIGYAFISNNSSDERIKLFNKNIGAVAFARSGKPFAKKNIDCALSSLGASRENAAFMGDQIFTDVCAGKFNGMRAILVPPIKDKKNLFFKFKRWLEKPVLNYYFKNKK